MEKTDEQLLDFDKDRLADWNPERAADALAGEFGALYRNHLEIAQWIDGWIENMGERQTNSNAKYQEGFVQGLREVAAHLRQTDLLPGGVLLED
ncbi:hypothetical protein [Streptomyces fumanus]|uniref:hypothetical protein n=1 Tax=Streptomyces fumanus TaxID=67302 RepID=UPI0033E995A9